MWPNIPHSVTAAAIGRSERASRVAGGASGDNSSSVPARGPSYHLALPEANDRTFATGDAVADAKLTGTDARADLVQDEEALARAEEAVQRAVLRRSRRARVRGGCQGRREARASPTPVPQELVDPGDRVNQGRVLDHDAEELTRPEQPDQEEVPRRLGLEGQVDGEDEHGGENDGDQGPAQEAQDRGTDEAAVDFAKRMMKLSGFYRG